MASGQQTEVGREELANAITHGFGLFLSIAGAVALVAVSILRGTVWHIVSCAVYGFTLVLLYLSSTLYHSVSTPRLKQTFRLFDHSAVYLLIAWTYTPFTLVNLRGGWGWTLFGVVWLLTLAGITFKYVALGRFPVLSTVVYLLMGWLVVLGIKPVLTFVPLHGFFWLLGGGLFYTVGVFFFATKRIPYSHAIWHVFALCGSICHYWAVFFYVLPHKTA
ncbi:MAG: hemolysin III family protein [Candidatus Sulfotelmatobacter sp.]